MSKTKKVRLLIGLPASGKSTWKKQFLAKNPDWVAVSRDDFRYMLRNQGVLEPKAENMITTLVRVAVGNATKVGYNVLVDETHCKMSSLTASIEAYSQIADVDYMYFDVPPEVCIERDSNRERSVGPDVIKRMHGTLKVVLDVFDFQPVGKKKRKVKDYTLDHKKELPDVILCDIDGTVAHMNGKRGPFEWHKVGLDDPDHTTIHMLKMLTGWADGPRLIMVTGRDESCRKETEEWLTAAGVDYDGVFMRPENDYRKDNAVKKEIYEQNIKGKYNVLFVLDDRQQVVEMWRELGLKCLQVEPGDF